MHKRIKALRKALDLTQQEFANRIGSKRNTIAKYETEANTPSAAVISLICREFNVNEDWLRNGTGGNENMFLPEKREDEIARTVKSLLNGENDAFKRRFINMLSRLSASDWERLEKEARSLLEPEMDSSTSGADHQTTTSIDELEAEYKKRVLEPAAKKASTVLNTTADTENDADKAAGQ